jgi:hypothetical protein
MSTRYAPEVKTAIGNFLRFVAFRNCEVCSNARAVESELVAGHMLATGLDSQ